jgi:hypothetical protein
MDNDLASLASRLASIVINQSGYCCHCDEPECKCLQRFGHECNCDFCTACRIEDLLKQETVIVTIPE